MKVVVLAVLCVAVLGRVSALCTCPDPKDANPLTTPLPDLEVVAFHPRVASPPYYLSYNTTYLTTVVKFGGNIECELVCWAHSKNIRVVQGVDFRPNSQLTNTTAVDAWIEEIFENVTSVGGDGVNIDIEGNTANRDALTNLTAKVYNRFKSWLPTSSVTFDTAIYASASNPGYDFVALNKYTDFLLPMAYDMCWGTKVAAANSPMPGILKGVNQYLSLGIPASQVALGLPWYAYKFPCLTATPKTACPTNFTGGDMQITYAQVVDLLQSTGATPVLDKATMSKYLEYVEDGTRYQVWYDDPSTLSAKYAAAGHLGMHGTAFWHSDSLNYSDPVQVQTMWGALDAL